MDTKRIAMVAMLAVVVALGFASSAQALTFTVGGGSTVADFPDPVLHPGLTSDDGLGIRTGDPRDGSVAAVSPISAPVPATFSLNVGETHSFDFFDIWTHEGVMNSSNDPIHRAIEATLDMTPADAPIVITGVTYASSSPNAHGIVEWDGPVTVTAGLCTYTVTLSDETFNWGSGGEFGGKDNDGWDGRAIVVATVELVSCDDGGGQPIAEPAGLSMLGLALLTIRKRRS